MDVASLLNRPVVTRVSIEPLPASCRPCFLHREFGITLLLCDPHAERADVVAFCVEHMRTDELNAFRGAYGQPTVGQPLDDFWLTPGPVPQYIPACLRLQGAPPMPEFDYAPGGRFFHESLQDDAYVQWLARQFRGRRGAQRRGA